MDIEHIKKGNDVLNKINDLLDFKKEVGNAAKKYNITSDIHYKAFIDDINKEIIDSYEVFNKLGENNE